MRRTVGRDQEHLSETHGLQLTGLVEHQSLPREALPGQMDTGADGEWRLRHAPQRLPLSYTLQAIKA